MIRVGEALPPPKSFSLYWEPREWLHNLEGGERPHPLNHLGLSRIPWGSPRKELLGFPWASLAAPGAPYWGSRGDQGRAKCFGGVGLHPPEVIYPVVGTQGKAK